MIAGNEDGGKASATILSLVQTCPSLVVNPQEYLKVVLRRIMAYHTKQIQNSFPITGLRPDRMPDNLPWFKMC